MNFSKIITTVAIILSVLKNESNASVICYYSAHNGYDIECNGIKKHFNDIGELSDNINNITGKYFTVDYIKSIDEVNTILFHNFSITSKL